MIARSSASAVVGVGAAALALLAYAGAAAGEDQPKPDSREALELRETKRLIQAELPRWRFEVGADRTALVLEPKPVLRWTNPATCRVNGDLYVWTLNGRPEAVMSLYKDWRRAWGFTGEFHSLSLVNLVGRREGAAAWKCDQPGVELREVPDGPAPADTPVRRLRQMRDIAADFSVVLIDHRRNTDGERQALRLLTSPVYRYQNPGGGVADGAIFAYVVGTDPEALLIVEALGKGNEIRWQYALARLNGDQLAAYHKEREVWRTDRTNYKDRDQPYVVMSLPEAPK
ncbi:MAG TPA: hypothetical protein VMV10_19320 [Pirellulales bacterium]|nr:hypothetical protein [Pirellulales bacterium]